MAAFALGTALFKSPQAAVLGALTMLILMVLLLVFAAAAAMGGRSFRMPALVMTWAILLLFIASATMTVSAVFFDRPKPFPVLIQQLWGSGAGPAPPPTQSRYEAHAYAIGDRLRTETSTDTISRHADSVNVGCEQNGSSEVRYGVPPDVTVLSHSAGWIDLDNIKSHDARSVISGSQVIGSGELRGLDQQLLNCPGGGHATLSLTVSIQRRVQTAVSSPPIEIGASELETEPISFGAPSDENLRVAGFRVDLRPIGSSGRFASINLPGCGSNSQEVRQRLFGTLFHLRCDGRSLTVQIVG